MKKDEREAYENNENLSPDEEEDYENDDEDDDDADYNDGQ